MADETSKVFWNLKTLEPRRNFRFKLNDSTDQWWWAKSVDKPSFDVSNNEYQLINHKFKYPGIVTWKPISITVADIGKKANSLIDELNKMGYVYPDAESTGLEKFYAGGKITGMSIVQLNESGGEEETWNLYGAFITSVSFSKLDYSSDDITEITIEVAYDFAKLS